MGYAKSESFRQFWKPSPVRAALLSARTALLTEVERRRLCCAHRLSKFAERSAANRTAFLSGAMVPKPTDWKHHPEAMALRARPPRSAGPDAQLQKRLAGASSIPSLELAPPTAAEADGRTYPRRTEQASIPKIRSV